MAPIAAFCNAIVLVYRDTPRLPIIAVQLNACTLGPWLDNREVRAWSSVCRRQPNRSGAPPPMGSLYEPVWRGATKSNHLVAAGDTSTLECTRCTFGSLVRRGPRIAFRRRRRRRRRRRPNLLLLLT